MGACVGGGECCSSVELHLELRGSYRTRLQGLASRIGTHKLHLRDPNSCMMYKYLPQEGVLVHRLRFSDPHR